MVQNLNYFLAILAAEVICIGTGTKKANVKNFFLNSKQNVLGFFAD